MASDAIDAVRSAIPTGFKIFKGTVFFESLESFFDKVIANLSPETISYLKKSSLPSTWVFDPTRIINDTGR